MRDLVDFVHTYASRVVCFWGHGPSIITLHPGSERSVGLWGASCLAFHEVPELGCSHLLRAGELWFSLVAAGPEANMALPPRHGVGKALPLAPAARDELR